MRSDSVSILGKIIRFYAFRNIVVFVINFRTERGNSPNSVAGVVTSTFTVDFFLSFLSTRVTPTRRNLTRISRRDLN